MTDVDVGSGALFGRLARRGSAFIPPKYRNQAFHSLEVVFHRSPSPENLGGTRPYHNQGKPNAATKHQRRWIDEVKQGCGNWRGNDEPNIATQLALRSERILPEE